MTLRVGTTLIGLGNPLLADDGLGLEVLARLAQSWDLGPDVTLEDGGCWGMNLLPILASSQSIVFVDAIKSGAVPGTLVRIEGDDLPKQLSMKLSPHQVDLGDVFAVAVLMDQFPPYAVAIGVEPELIETRVGLSPSVARRVDDCVDAVIRELRALGHQVVPRARPRYGAAIPDPRMNPLAPLAFVSIP